MSYLMSPPASSHIEAGKTAARSGHRSIEALPAELKVDILKRLDTVANLRSLVHASSSFHNSYLLAREEIFTAVTLHDLSSRSVDPFQPFVYLELCLRDRSEPDEVLEVALTTIRTQRKAQIRARNSGNRIAPIKVSIEDCISLLKLDDILGWDPTQYFGNAGFHLLHTCAACVLRVWANGRKNYHGTLMRDSPAGMARLMARYPGPLPPRPSDVADFLFQNYFESCMIQIGLMSHNYPINPMLF